MQPDIQTYEIHEIAVNSSWSTDNISSSKKAFQRFLVSSLEQDEYCKYFLVGYCPGKTLGREIESVLVSAMQFLFFSTMS